MLKSLFFLLPVFFGFSLKAQEADTAYVLDHLENLTNTITPRNHLNLNSLNQVGDYIHKEFSKYADSTRFQEFDVSTSTYRNVIGSFGTEHEERLIVGAHYDVCGNQDGADDNASGVVGLLEIARLLDGKKLNTRIDLVAYSLEEPPYFRSENMGSYKHAAWLNANNIPVRGMICLEMIGYFDERKGSQDYPIGLLKLFYGSKGDFITVVSKMGRGKFARQYKRKMKRTKHIKTKAFQGPAGLPGIDFSDHLNYWAFDYSAVMITNTAFYRNKNYHQTTDRINTLDIPKMTGVIQAVYETIIKLTVD